MKKEPRSFYPLSLVQSLMNKAKEKAIKEDIPFNQWLREAVKDKLKKK